MPPAPGKDSFASEMGDNAHADRKEGEFEQRQNGQDKEEKKREKTMRRKDKEHGRTESDA